MPVIGIGIEMGVAGMLVPGMVVGEKNKKVLVIITMRWLAVTGAVGVSIIIIALHAISRGRKLNIQRFSAVQKITVNDGSGSGRGSQ